ncbi:tail fiber domain-containing protein [sulfur-oxidizing endosymbiont of Gigantopelta aegis]|uniref:tail fiber domain-containing protein n=1 Tax=sulfur-oxidizing endosymbiont of Gigantopelta aegis TaxID=2794934 RepID=UPI0018DE9757|nr:tail fiber domain-containing protein [sulfur-oxidizing endosymbiont of Gigantopelta aegis]
MPKTHSIRLAIISTFFSITLCSSVNADIVNIPNTFSNGSVADAIDVNDNFTALEDEANAKDARLALVEQGKFISTHFSLSNNDDGLFNTILGYQAGFSIKKEATHNVAVGHLALFSNTTGKYNTASGNNALYYNTSGYRNTATGNTALNSNTSGFTNTANGNSALYSNTTGYSNTATGSNALFSNTSGIRNTAMGAATLSSNTTGDSNTAMGYNALENSTTGSKNTATGFWALNSNTTGSENTATGTFVLERNTTGSSNTANGFGALKYNTSGESNTAIGYDALSANQIGSFNTASGAGALKKNNTGIFNTAFGYNALRNNTSGQYNTAIGYNAGNIPNNLFNSTAIGYYAKVNSSNTIRLGNTSIATIEGQVPFTSTSDRRLKEDITTTSLGLAFINDLNPVQYHRINNQNPALEMGIIAQELDAVLKHHDASNMGMIHQVNNGMMSVRYNDLLAPIIKSVQELSAENNALKTELSELKALILSRNKYE